MNEGLVGTTPQSCAITAGSGPECRLPKEDHVVSVAACESMNISAAEICEGMDENCGWVQKLEYMRTTSMMQCGTHY